MVKYTPGVLFLYFYEGDFSRAYTEENTQQCQARNGLKCSTVGNLGSYWAIVIMLLEFTHFFVGQSQKGPKFSNSLISTKVRLALGMLRLNGLNTNRSAIKVV